MNLFTLALRNIKSNVTKYIMFFFSLSFSVFTCYTFFALMENESVGMAFRYDIRYKALLSSFGVIIMVFVMFFLISSSNSFLRARKKEISTYALFGMSNGRIGLLIYIETMIVGFVSMVVAIGAGIFFSKLVTMFLVKLATVNYDGSFLFSVVPQAIVKTVVIFFIIFSLMGLSGLWVISRFQLVDLFKASKVSEGKNNGSWLLLMISLLLIGGGYYIAYNGDPMELVMMANVILLLVIVGSYLFFRGGLPKVLHLIKGRKERYYKDANLIATAAFSHRMRSIGSVMATISILTAVATTAIATGFTLYTNIESASYDINGFDIFITGGETGLFQEVEAYLQGQGASITEKFSTPAYYGTLPQNDRSISIRVMDATTYNQLISYSKANLKEVNLQPGEGVLFFPYFQENEEIQQIREKGFDFAGHPIPKVSVQRNRFIAFGVDRGFVVADENFQQMLALGALTPEGEILGFNYENGFKELKLNQGIMDLIQGKSKKYTFASEYYVDAIETFGLVCFIGFFMSVVFILMTASLLYFKQVTAAEEERHQYHTLRKIGMPEDVERRVIKKRLVPVFAIPLVMGIIHSIFAMKTADTMVFNQLFFVENTFLSVLKFSFIMYGVYGVVYGIFYFITKDQYSKIVR